MYSRNMVAKRQYFIRLNEAVYAAIVDDWRNGRFTADRVSEHVYGLARAAEDMGDTELELVYACYAYHLKKGHLLKFICTTIHNRLQDGHTFRAALLWSYKAGHR